MFTKVILTEFSPVERSRRNRTSLNSSGIPAKNSMDGDVMIITLWLK